MVLENDVDVGLDIEAPFEDSTDLGRGGGAEREAVALFSPGCRCQTGAD